MQTIFNLVVLSICLNIGMGVMAETFGLDIPLYIDLQSFVDAQEDLSAEFNSTANSQGFSTIFIFGDFVKVLQVFINAFTGQYLLGTLQMLGGSGIMFPDTFYVGIAGLYAVGAVWGIMYIVSGRGTKQSD